jgi:hypothetical protein
MLFFEQKNQLNLIKNLYVKNVTDLDVKNENNQGLVLLVIDLDIYAKDHNLFSDIQKDLPFVQVVMEIE